MRLLALALLAIASLLPQCLACSLCRMEGGACAAEPVACCNDEPACGEAAAPAPRDAAGDRADAGPGADPCCCPGRCSGPTVASPVRVEDSAAAAVLADLAPAAPFDLLPSIAAPGDLPAARAAPASPPRPAGSGRLPLRI